MAGPAYYGTGIYGVDWYGDLSLDPGPPPPGVAPDTFPALSDAIAGRIAPANLTYQVYRLDHATFAVTEDITTAIVEGTASIDLDNSRPVLRSVKMDILPDNLPADWGDTDETVGFYATARLADGSLYSMHLGVYDVDAPEHVHRPGSEMFRGAKAADMCYRLQTKTKSDAHTVLGGSSYISAVNALVSDAGLQAYITDPGLTTPADFTWPPYTPYLVVINDLLYGMNYYPAWAMVDGRITSRERVDPALEVAALSYSAASEPRMVVPPFTMSLKRQGIQNRFVITVQDPNRPPAAATAENIDSASPVSLPVTGLPVTGQANGDRAADVTTLQAIARFEVRAAALQRLQGQLGTLLDPRRDAHETYQVDLDDFSVAAPWRVMSWSLPLKVGGVMTHTLVHVDSVSVKVT